MQRFLSVVLPPLLILAGCASHPVHEAPNAVLPKVRTAQEIRELVASLGSDAEWQAAADQLVQEGHRSVPFLTEALREGDKNVGSRAVECISRMNAREVWASLNSVTDEWDEESRKLLEPALRRLLREPDMQMICGVAQRLRQLGARDLSEPAAIRFVIANLGHSEIEKRREAYWAAELLGCEEFFEPLLKILVSPPQQGKYGADRGGAAHALAAIGSRKATKPLLVAMLDQPEARWAAAEALAGIGDLSASPTLLCLLESPSIWLRRAAARALGFAGNRDAIAPLSAVATNPDEPEVVRHTAVQSLGRIGLPDAVPALSSVAEDKERSLRCEAVRALCEIGHDRCVEPLIKALGSEEWDSVMFAAEALGRMGDRRAVPALLAVLKRPGAAHVAIVAAGPFNAATAAHGALVAITGIDPLDGKASSIRSELELAAVRQAWVKALKAEQAQPAQ